MPTSATGSNTAAGNGVGGPFALRVGGFTFIELLVTILLLGLLVSLAVLSLQTESAADRLEREAARLYARMDLAREEAVLQVRTLGLRVEDGRYRFLVFAREGWRALADDRILPEHELPETTRLEAELDGMELALENPDTDSEEQRPPPQIFFLASGEILPDFALRLTAEDTDVEFTIEPGDEQWLELSDSRD